MIKTLRLKLILINMSLASLVLIVVFAVMAIDTYSSAIMDSRISLTRVLEQRAGIEQAKPEILPREPFLDMPANDRTPSDAPELQPAILRGMDFKQANIHLTATFSVLINAKGELTDTETSEVTISDEVVSAAARAAYELNTDEGVIDEYSLRFKVRKEGDFTRIAFVDRERELTRINDFLSVSLKIGAVAFPALFFISLLLSNLAVKPIKFAWEREKQFVADASHELKTPLTVILANTDILKQKVSNNNLKWVESTREESLRMKSLVEDMLFLAKADAEDKPYIMEQVPLSDVVWNASLQFEAVAFERSINIVENISDNISALTNAKAVKQILGILLDNALKHAPAGSEVSLSLMRKHDSAIISVRNYGEPIPREALTHLFERFYRADDSRARDSGGFGLGLSIAKRISERLSSTLEVTSDEKTGTTFTLSIPIK